MDPARLTLRKLALMGEARRRDEWSRWSVLLALLRNAHRGPGEAAVAPDEMNPYREEGPAPRAGVETLRAIFWPGEGGDGR